MELRTGEPYWLSVADDPTPNPPLERDERCELAIIGGGISGGLLAYRLLEQGRDVVLLDKRNVGLGSTAASTSLLQYEIDVELSKLIPRMGEQDAVRAYRLGLQAIETVRSLTESLCDDCSFRRRSSLYLASAESDVPLLREEHRCRTRAGFKVEFLDRRDVESRFPFSAAAAILSEGAGEINTLHFTRKLLEHATARGLRLHANTLVERIEPRDDGVILHTANRHRVVARRVIFATGYEAREHLKQSVGKLRSTFAAASAPIGPFPPWPGRCLIWETARPYFYMRTTSDDRILIGGEDCPGATDHRQEGMVEAKTRILVERFKRMFPDVPFHVSHAWGGTFAETRDGLPYIGQTPEWPNAYFALGYGGNGVTMSVIAADIIADLCLGKENPDARLFRFDR